MIDDAKTSTNTLTSQIVLLNQVINNAAFASALEGLSTFLEILKKRISLGTLDVILEEAGVMDKVKGWTQVSAGEDFEKLRSAVNEITVRVTKIFTNYDGAMRGTSEFAQNKNERLSIQRTYRIFITPTLESSPEVIKNSVPVPGWE